jgi:hypothetical protein
MYKLSSAGDAPPRERVGVRAIGSSDWVRLLDVVITCGDEFLRFLLDD